MINLIIEIIAVLFLLKELYIIFEPKLIEPEHDGFYEISNKKIEFTYKNLMRIGISLFVIMCFVNII